MPGATLLTQGRGQQRQQWHNSTGCLSSPVDTPGEYHEIVVPVIARKDGCMHCLGVHGASSLENVAWRIF